MRYIYCVSSLSSLACLSGLYSFPCVFHYQTGTGSFPKYGSFHSTKNFATFKTGLKYYGIISWERFRKIELLFSFRKFKPFGRSSGKRQCIIYSLIINKLELHSF